MKLHDGTSNPSSNTAVEKRRLYFLFLNLWDHTEVRIVLNQSHRSKGLAHEWSLVEWHERHGLYPGHSIRQSQLQWWSAASRNSSLDPSRTNPTKFEIRKNLNLKWIRIELNSYLKEPVEYLAVQFPLHEDNATEILFFSNRTGTKCEFNSYKKIFKMSPHIVCLCLSSAMRRITFGETVLSLILNSRAWPRVRVLNIKSSRMVR